MARKRITKNERAGPGIPFGDWLAKELKDPEARHHFVQRRMAHEVALAVHAMRERAGLTQVELARRIGSSQPSVARIEKGLGYRTPQWETLEKIARALGKQLKLAFIEADESEPLVEIDGMPLTPPRTSDRLGRTRSPTLPR